MTDSVPSVRQKDVDRLLVHLQHVHQQIQEAREAVAPLEANVALAYSEYEAAVGRLRREGDRLQTEIAIFRARLEGTSRDQEEATLQESFDDGKHPKDRGERDPVSVDPDALEKDRLLEHLFRTLDDEDDHLLSTLQGMCVDPTVRLADALEKIPWGAVWTVRGPHEDLDAQYRRLTSWEEGLLKQLEQLTRKIEDLGKHPHYGLWRQRQRGPKAWQGFLRKVAEQQEEYNDRLEAELESMRQQWANMVDNI